MDSAIVGAIVGAMVGAVVGVALIRVCDWAMLAFRDHAQNRRRLMERGKNAWRLQAEIDRLRAKTAKQ